MSRNAVFLLVVLIFGLVPRVAEAKKPIVAVFAIQDRTGEIQEDALQQFTDYLTAKIAEGGVFQVVPGSQLKERLTQQKVESYKSCYDEKCQIEIGRELAAQKSLSTHVVKVGTSCALVSTLYNLKRATSESAASEKGACTKDEIASMLERVATSIKSQAQLKAGPGVGGLLVASKPPGAEVFLDGKKAKGTTPVSIPFIKEGEHALMLTKGDYRYVGKVKVVADQIASVSYEMEKVSEAMEREKAERERRMVELRKAIALARTERRSKTIWGYTTLGVAGAAAITVGVLYGVGFTQQSSADDKYMAASTQEEMNTNWADVEAANRMILAGHIVAGVGGLALAFSLYELLTRPEIPSANQDPSSVSISYSPTGLTISGRFWWLGGGR